MQLDDCPFEILPDEGPTEEQKRDIVWLGSPEGVDWAMDQQPMGKLIRSRAETKVIIRRLQPMVPTTHPAGKLYLPKHVRQFYFPRGGIKDVEAHVQSTPRMVRRRAIREWDLWRMPYLHTTYVSDVEKYWHWYTEIRPGFHSWMLSDHFEAEQMHEICVKIARERQNVRRAA